MRGLPTWSKRRYAQYWCARAELPGSITYAALGDSAAQGVGASAPERGYVGLLAERITGLAGQKVRVVNLSVSGAKIADVIAGQLPMLSTIDADVVTLDIGGNDVRRFDEEVFERQAEALISRLPRGTVVADIPCFHGGRSERRALVGARILRDLSRRHGLPVARLHEATEARRDAQERHDFALDLFHPNDTGYRVWESAFIEPVEARVRSLVL